MNTVEWSDALLLDFEPMDGVHREFVDLLALAQSAPDATLPQALDKMYERMPTPELKFFAIVIGIQQKTGGNLAEALNNLSVVLRARKMMGEKIKALSSEATASAGIIGSLPFIVAILVSLTTPTYLLPLFNTTIGVAGLWDLVRRMSGHVDRLRRLHLLRVGYEAFAHQQPQVAPTFGCGALVEHRHGLGPAPAFVQERAVADAWTPASGADDRRARPSLRLAASSCRACSS